MIAQAPLWWFAGIALSLSVILLWIAVTLIARGLAAARRREAPLAPSEPAVRDAIGPSLAANKNATSLEDSVTVRNALLEDIKPQLARVSAESEATGQVILSGEERERRDAAAAELVAETSPAAEAAAEAIAAGDFDSAVATLKRDAAAASADAADRWRRLGALLRGADIAEARAAYEEAHRLQPDDFWTGIELARLCEDCGDRAAALSAATLAEAAAETDDERLLAVSETGDIRMDGNDLAGAKESYGAALEIAARLATLNPGHLGWQRELSVSHNKVGDVRLDQGDLAGALESYAAALLIRERLVAQDPDNAGRLHDLSFSHARVGDVQLGQGDRPAALESFGAALDIAERLAVLEPDNPVRQAELAERHSQLGRLLKTTGEHDLALETLEQGRALVAPLAERSQAPLWQRYLRTFDADIAALQG